MPHTRRSSTRWNTGANPKFELWRPHSDSPASVSQSFERRVRWLAGMILIIAGLAGLALVNGESDLSPESDSETFVSAAAE